MKFLAIDSSLRHTGIAVGNIDKDDNIKVELIDLHHTEKSNNKQVRASSDAIDACRLNFKYLQDVINTHKPQIIFAETPSGSQSSSGMKSYGATCQLIASLVPEAIEVTPNEVKMSTVGNKKASKRDMIDWANGKHPDVQWTYHGGRIKNDNEHMADAICIVYAGIKTRMYNQLKALLNG
jgi:Holliday junction resolvasome RuvABC endonuclease subunit